MLKLGKLSGFFKKLLYKDTMDVYRLQLRKNDDFSSTNEQIVTPVYMGIPCKISNNYHDLPEEDSFLVNPTNAHYSVFCEPTYKIRKGDKLIIHRFDDNKKEVETINQYAGKPSIEINHQEITLVDKEYA